ncbi:MAG: VOC family protein [Ilumatobacteraceae bacterium]
MGFHHVALATRDTAATHRFYTDVMGFELVKVVAGPTPGDQGGWSKHFFYSTNNLHGGAGAASGDPGMIAFWELHDDTIGNDFAVDLNKPNGLPGWVNHIAFDAPTMDDLTTHRERWQAHGHTVLEVNHEFCVSIYISDPSGNTVEFCHTTRDFTPEEIERAQALVLDPSPQLDTHEPVISVYHPTNSALATSPA